MRLHLVLVVLVWCLYSVESCPECPESNWEHDDAWEKYVVDYNKVYDSCPDECDRRVIWEGRWKYIEEFKRLSDEDCTYEIELNPYADWTDEEISDGLHGVVLPPTVASDEPESMNPPIPTITPPTYFDYTDLGYVTPVKDQGSCGNCWAFAAAGAMEGRLFKSRGHLIDVSVQQLTDCCKNGKLYGCYGCKGGWMNGAFRCTNDTGGIVTSDVYTLKRMDQECLIPAGHARYLCNDYIKTVRYNESNLMQHLLNAGPIACTIDASPMTFTLYKSGIYSDPNCPREINHAVLITGYGTTSDGVDYWIIKNSWGTDWGEKGYFRLIRGSNLCDIAHYCYYPVDCKSVERPPGE